MLQAAKYLLGSPGASGFGSRSTAEEVTAACLDIGSLTAIITGATSGIGAETARVLAKRGVRVVIPARNVKAAEDMRARILGEFPGADVLVLHLDLSSLASVRSFAQRFLALVLPLHLLINNAGKFSHGQLALSEDGVESHAPVVDVLNDCSYRPRRGRFSAARRLRGRQRCRSAGTQLLSRGQDPIVQNLDDRPLSSAASTIRA